MIREQQRRTPEARSAAGTAEARAGMGDSIDASPVLIAQRMRIRQAFGSAAAQGAAVVQRVITFTDDSSEHTVEQLFERYKTGAARDAKKLLDKQGPDGLRAFLQAQDGKPFKNSNALLAEMRKAAERGQAGLARTAFVVQGRKMLGPGAEAFDGILEDARITDELAYKLALVGQLKDSATYVEPFLKRAAQLAFAFAKKAPINWAGIKKTFEIVTDTWSQEPDYFLTGPGLVSLIGKSNDGIPTSIKGLTAELDAICSVDPGELAAGEHVFSASNYTDAQDAQQTKDVDISYIDGDGSLHLIEAAKDMNTLENKLTGSKKNQKKIYSYLANRSQALVHTPQGGLTPQQAQRNQIARVVWWYTVPAEQFDPGRKDVIRELVRAGAGLRAGSTRFSPEALAKLLD